MRKFHVQKEMCVDGRGRGCGRRRRHSGCESGIVAGEGVIASAAGADRSVEKIPLMSHKISNF